MDEDILTGGTFSNVGQPQADLTEASLTAMLTVMRNLSPAPPRVILKISDAAVTPRVLHSKGRCYKRSYHLRIQKKWNRRFGMQPTCYEMMNPGFFGRSNDIILICHSALEKE